MTRHAVVATGTRHRSMLAMALLSVGTITLALGVFSGGASAWEGSCYDYAPSPGAWAEFRIETADTDIARVAGAGQSFDDGSLHVVLSGASAAEANPLTTATIASIDFAATPGVAAVYVRAGIETDNIYIYDEPTTAGSGLRAKDDTTPIEWLTFCYAVPTQETSTTSTTSTSTSTSTTTTPTTTTLAPTTTVQNAVEVTSTTAPTAVLGVQIERVAQPQLALTGANSSRLILLGVLFIVAGLAIMVINHGSAQWRRTN